jgi:hypothetical protein
LRVFPLGSLLVFFLPLAAVMQHITTSGFCHCPNPILSCHVMSSQRPCDQVQDICNMATRALQSEEASTCWPPAAVDLPPFSGHPYWLLCFAV